jgi:enamine deaminase RidA (YjgF/YER057c/UK114 family)
LIFVSGTTAVALDHQSPPLQAHAATGPQIQYPGDAKRQTIVALKECLKAIEALAFAHRHSSAENDQAAAAASVVRVRMFVANQKDCAAVGEGFREVLGKGNESEYGYEGIGAAATMIVVPGGFVHDEMLVEIEVDAIVEED